jgi:hypothetical protein
MNPPDLDAVPWRTSTRSGPDGNCVEVAKLDDAVAVRDSKRPTGPALMFTPAEWEAFISGVKEGEFDLT